jgi:endonuclease/exonuclease/phosphatase family metal-dependent hydrolase
MLEMLWRFRELPCSSFAGGVSVEVWRRIENIMVRRCADRSGSAAVSLLAAGCGLVLALAGCSQSSPVAVAVAAPPPPGATYTLMQMNLCLSGLAGCYGKVDYPAGVQAAVARIREAHPDAVTFNEACRRDVVLIARRTGYHLRFSKVIYYGKPLLCVRPGGRGLFGDAVLTQAAIQSTDSQAFEAQAGPERRRWLCVSTRIDVDVCTAHLASPEADEVAANDPQCAELRALLARRAAVRTLIFGGDVNRRPSCAPLGFWTRTDSSAHQDPGSQQVYGTRAFRSPSARVQPATHTDHDVLLVRAHLTAQR